MITPPDIQVFNPAFDVTPHELITGIITEKGQIKGNYEEQIPALEAMSTANATKK